MGSCGPGTLILETWTWKQKWGVWRADLGDRAGTKQATWAHLPRQVTPAWTSSPGTTNLPGLVLDSVIRETEMLVLYLPPPSKLPEQSEPQFPHLCSGNLLLSRGLGGETPTTVAKVPNWGGCRGHRPRLLHSLSVVLAEMPHERTIWPKCLQTKFNWEPERI